MNHESVFTSIHYSICDLNLVHISFFGCKGDELELSTLPPSLSGLGWLLLGRRLPDLQAKFKPKCGKGPRGQSWLSGYSVLAFHPSRSWTLPGRQRREKEKKVDRPHP